MQFSYRLYILLNCTFFSLKFLLSDMNIATTTFMQNLCININLLHIYVYVLSKDACVLGLQDFSFFIFYMCFF